MESYPLRERTILLAGPMGSTTQNLILHLCGQGADVALLHDQANQAEKFCQQITDQREINPKHGRAMAVTVALNQLDQIKDAVGRVAQTFGGLDVLIDAQIGVAASAFDFENKDYKFENQIDQYLKSTLWLTQAVVGSLKNRKKGRIIYLLSEAAVNGNPLDTTLSAVRGGLVPFTKSLAMQLADFSVTVNVLQLAACEEYLTGHFPGKSAKEALAEYQKWHYKARITEPDRISNAVSFLLGPSGAGISGQVLNVN